jgi:hypothetical protein
MDTVLVSPGASQVPSLCALPLPGLFSSSRQNSRHLCWQGTRKAHTLYKRTTLLMVALAGIYLFSGRCGAHLRHLALDMRFCTISLATTFCVGHSKSEHGPGGAPHWHAAAFGGLFFSVLEGHGTLFFVQRYPPHRLLDFSTLAFSCTPSTIGRQSRWRQERLRVLKRFFLYVRSHRGTGRDLMARSSDVEWQRSAATGQAWC